MHRYFSPAATPGERGHAFGRDHPAQIRRVLRHYHQLFDHAAGEPVPLRGYGEQALAAIGRFSPAAAEEIAGIAAGAGCTAQEVAALNARTEILATIGASTRGECSTVVSLMPGVAPPVSVQTWDWHDLMAEDWLLWTIEHDDGSHTHTVTEFGVLGKIGVNSHGVGTHFNILHHRSDGGSLGVPVHILSRTLLDTCQSIDAARALLTAAQVSASSVLTVVEATSAGSGALAIELCPQGPRFVPPTQAGLLVHTNHFLDPTAAAGDLEPVAAPDTLARHDLLCDALTGRSGLTRDDIVAAMASHQRQDGAVCRHPEPGAGFGDRWRTLATVALDVAHGTVHVRSGGPCEVESPWISPLDR